MDKVYAFCFSDCESGGVVTLHKTKKGAYKAMREHLVADYNEWFNNRLLFGKKETYFDKFNHSNLDYYSVVERNILD
jgi:hypothetical protein